MIVSRAPMRISFLGGGTDLPDFYRRYPGRVISTAIDKFVHVVLNRTPLIDKVSARYTASETVDSPNELRHTRIKAALLDLGISKGIEIASFATLPQNTGMGSSSTFSVALMKALYAYQGKSANRMEIAEAASRLEIELVGDPIGKQDQYAAAFGGFNVFQFNVDGSVEVKPILLDYQKSFNLQNHILLFFTGITREASSVLVEQKANIQKNFEILKAMSDSVSEFEARLLKGDIKGLGSMLHDGWLRKKSLTSITSNSVIDGLYEAGMSGGAWGGKVLGAGSGGCILFLIHPEKRSVVHSELAKKAATLELRGAKEIPIVFVQSGVEILHNSDKNISF